MTSPVERLTEALKGRYALERELGAGGMATVYLAHDLKHDRKVAIKVLRPELAQHLGHERFLREVRLAASLQHPHIVPLYDSGESDGFLWYVMPYVKGESLRERLVRERELPVGEAVRILRDVADALAFAHGEAVVHRDIKPDNVMLSGRHALVADFGVAKAVSEATGRHELTTAGVALGTPAYMAPEQAAAEPVIDHRADVYALGAMAYELVAGQPPFTSGTAQGILMAHVTQAPDPVTNHRPTLPPALAALIMRCLEKKPADRWQSAEELVRQLEQLATPGDGTAPVAAVAAARRSRPLGVPRTPLIGAAAIVVAALAWWQWGSGRRHDIERIAVLPVENATGDTAQAFYAEGFTHELIGVLTRMGVRVLGPRAVARYQGTDRTPSEIAGELEVGGLVFARLLAVGDSLRLAVELMDAATEENIWSESFGAPAAEVIALQNRVATAIAGELRQGSADGERGRAAAARPVNREAYAQYLLGQQQALRWTRAGFERSVEHFRRAVSLDPGFAGAYAGLARAYDWAVWYGWIAPDSGRAIIMDNVTKALARDDRLGEAYVTRAFVEFHIDWRFDQAEASFQRGLQLAPLASEYQQYAVFLAVMGRLDSAASIVRKAIELEPGVAQWHSDLGWWLFPAGRVEEAIAAAKEALRLDPSFWEAHQLLGITYRMAGRYEDAERELTLAAQLGGNVGTYTQYQWVRLYAATGRLTRAREALAEMETWDAFPRRFRLGALAAAYMALGVADTALTLLEQALELRDLHLPSMLTREGSLFDPLRSSPRFRRVVQGVGLPDAEQIIRGLMR